MQFTVWITVPRNSVPGAPAIAGPPAARPTSQCGQLATLVVVCIELKQKRPRIDVTNGLVPGSGLIRRSIANNPRKVRILVLVTFLIEFQITDGNNKQAQAPNKRFPKSLAL